MKRLAKRLLSVLLVMLLLIECGQPALAAVEAELTKWRLPNPAALEVKSSVSEEEADSYEADSYHQEVTAADVQFEIVDLRSSDTKHFRLADGSSIAVKYDTNVHYQNEAGGWVDIDNSLSETTETFPAVREETAAQPLSTEPPSDLAENREDSEPSSEEVIVSSGDLALLREADSRNTGPETMQAQETVEVPMLETSDSIADIQIAAKSATAETADFSISNDQYSLGFSLVDAAEKEAEILPAEDSVDLSSVAAAVTLPKLTSVVRYENVLDGIDLEYVIHGEDIKENIIVKNRRESYTFSFDLDLQNLYPQAQEDGSISLRDKSTKEEIYLIPAPQMEDAKGETSTQVRYELVPAAEFYQKREAEKQKAGEIPETEEIPETQEIQETPSPQSDVSAQLSDMAFTQMPSPAGMSVIAAAESEVPESIEPESAEEAPDAAESIEPEGTPEPIAETPAPAEETPAPTAAPEIPEETPAPTQAPKTEYGENDYVFVVTADEVWMEEDAREYPVTIDPPIIVQYGKTQDRQMSTCYVKSGSPNEVTGDYGLMYLGYSGVSNSQKNRIYTRVNELPALPSDSIVVNAGIYFCQLEYSHVDMPDMDVPVYALSTGPNGSTDSQYSTSGTWIKSRTWNTQPYYHGQILDTAVIGTSTEYSYVRWDVTGITKQWYSGEAKNYGLAFIPYQESKFTGINGGNATFVAYNSNSYASYKPKFIVQYRNTAGIEDYYTCETQSVARAGTGYVNDQTGQITLVKTDASNASQVQPFTLSHIYNGVYAQRQFSYIDNDTSPMKFTKDFSKMAMGWGWKLNVQETITEITMKDTSENNVTYFVQNDADGTYHYFAKDPSKNDGYYYDEDGLNLKISKSGTTYTMVDEKNNKKYFYNGILGMVEDRNGNKIRMIYNSASAASSGTAWQPKGTGDQLLQIRQQLSGATEITLANLAYTATGFLSSVTDRAGLTTQYQYASSRLTAVVHPDGTRAVYTYDGTSSKMTAAEDTECGRKLAYGYVSNEIHSIAEYGNGVKGKEKLRRVGIHNYAMYRNLGADNKSETADDTLEFMMFDYAGRTVNYYITDSTERKVLAASNMKYTAASGVSKEKNRVAQKASVGVSSMNMLKNPGAESTASWSIYGDGLSFTTEKARTGLQSMKSTNSKDGIFYQQVNLIKGKTYTFSVYVNTSAANFPTSTSSVYLYIEDQRTDLFRVKTSEDIAGGWQRLSLSYTAKSTDPHNINIIFQGIEGVVYADDLQLEEGDAAGNANLLSNGNFEGSDSWTLTNTSPYKAEYSTADALSGSRSLMMQGAPDGFGLSYQDVYVNLPGTETFVLSGWAKANSIPTSGGYTPSFVAYAEIFYSDNTSERHGLHFQSDVQAGTYKNSALNGWQYGSVAVVPQSPTKTVRRIRVNLAYNKNANTVYYDNLCLIREFAQTFKYDTDGKLVSVKKSGENDTNYTYSGANLIKEVTNGSGTYQYTYDSKNNPTSVTNDKLSMGVTYDPAGNATKSTLNDSGYARTYESTAAYSADKNLLTSVTDTDKVQMNYSYGTAVSQMNGTPTTVKNNATGVSINNTYAADSGRQLMSYQSGYASITNVYINGLLGCIDRGGYLTPGAVDKKMQYYGLHYDVFGNLTSVHVDATGTGSYHALVSYEYEGYNGNLKKMNYGNGASSTYTYDYLDRLTQETFSDGTVYKYFYNGDGALSRMTNNQSSEVFEYDYDTLGRLVNFTEKFAGNVVNAGSYKYDSANRVEKYAYNIPGTTPAGGRYEQSTYSGVNGNLTSFRTAAGSVLTNTYGGLNRITSQKLGDFYSVNYAYKHNSADMTTSTRLDYKQYAILSQAATGMSYTYDAAGNITSEINKMTGYTSSYTYDKQNQLSTAKVAGAATYDFTYAYDTYGNLRSKTKTQGSVKQTDTYTYGDNGWLDLLTAYNGKTITYDTIGNPLTYHDGTTFSWEKGRRLSSLNQASKNLSASYVYSANGQRMQKTVRQNGSATVHQFYLQEGRLLGEARGGDRLEYIYDSDGAPLILIYNGVWYYYITNQMGDVVQLRDGQGTVYASYTYDPYGALLSSSGSMAAVNPLRYRGYYYDEETGFYLTGSRYYDPVVGRWLSPEPNIYQGDFDDGAGMMAYNVYAYCANNPVNYIDPTGEFIITALIVGAIIGGAIGGTVSYNAAKETGKTGSDLFWATVAGVGKGAVIGGVGSALIGGTAGVVGVYGATSVAGTAMISGTATIAAKATEVTALQIKKSTSEGKSGWQTANDSISSVFSNGGKVIGATPLTKAGSTAAMWQVKDIAKHKVIPLPFNTYLGSAGGKLGYAFAGYAWLQTGSSIFSKNPVARAVQRGYTLR